MFNVISFDELIGKSAIFCGIGDNIFRLGDITLEAIEDEDDGYRSALLELRVIDNIPVQFKENVDIISTERGIALRGKFGIILEVGTDNSDEYYPCFIFNYIIQNLSSNIALRLNTVTE